MTENWNIQASFKTQKGALVNVRADSPEGLAVNLTALSSVIPLILSVEQSLVAADNVAQGLPLAPPEVQHEVQPQQAPTPDPWSPQAPPQQNQWGQQQQYPQNVVPLPTAPAQPPVGYPQPAPGSSFPGASGAPAPQQQYAPPTQPGQLLCKHGQPAKVVPAGISKTTGRPYKAFAVCANDKPYQCDFRQTLA